MLLYPTTEGCKQNSWGLGLSFPKKLSASSKPLSKCAGCPETLPFLARSWVGLVCLFEVAHWHWSERSASCSRPSSAKVSLINCLTPAWTLHTGAATWFCASHAGVVIFAGVVMHCVKDEHTAINMNLHYLENGCVMVNFIFRKELFFLPLGFALKVSSECLCFLYWINTEVLQSIFILSNENKLIPLGVFSVSLPVLVGERTSKL